MSSLTKQQQRTLMYIGGVVLGLGLAGGLMWDLNGRRAQVTRLQQEVEQKERQAQNARPPSPEDQSKWADQEQQLSTVLLADQGVGQFFEEVGRIASDNHLQRFSMDTNEKMIDPATETSPEQTKVLTVGVRRYLVIAVKFSGQYPDIARFVGGVGRLNRPLEFQSIELKRSPPFIDVVVVMNVYKRESV